MGYNPCGAIVEWGRHRYKTAVRFFRDSDQEQQIQWYPALPDARALPWPSAIHQEIWDRDNYSQPIVDGVGEVYDAKHTTTHMLPVAGADGSHLCGTRTDFEFGALYDPALDIQYRPDGLPECCPGAVPKGIMWGSPPPQPAGIKWGGRAPEGEFTSGDSCFTSAYAVLGEVTTPLVVRPITTIPAAESLWVWLVTGVTGTTLARIKYRGFGTGTVQLWLMVRPSFCSFSSLIYTGPADEPFEIDVHPTFVRDVALNLVTSPDPTGAIILEILFPPFPP